MFDFEHRAGAVFLSWPVQNLPLRRQAASATPMALFELKASMVSSTFADNVWGSHSPSTSGCRSVILGKKRQLSSRGVDQVMSSC